MKIVFSIPIDHRRTANSPFRGNHWSVSSICMILCRITHIHLVSFVSLRFVTTNSTTDRPLDIAWRAVRFCTTIIMLVIVRHLGSAGEKERQRYEEHSKRNSRARGVRLTVPY